MSLTCAFKTLFDFKLVVYDPPHLTSGSEKSVIKLSTKMPSLLTIYDFIKLIIELSAMSVIVYYATIYFITRKWKD